MSDVVSVPSELVEGLREKFRLYAMTEAPLASPPLTTIEWAALAVLDAVPPVCRCHPADDDSGHCLRKYHALAPALRETKG